MSNNPSETGKRHGTESISSRKRKAHQHRLQELPQQSQDELNWPKNQPIYTLQPPNDKPLRISQKSFESSQDYKYEKTSLGSNTADIELDQDDDYILNLQLRLKDHENEDLPLEED